MADSKETPTLPLGGMKIYLSGEIHTDWRDRIIDGAKGLDVTFTGPVTNHAASDDCGVAIMGRRSGNSGTTARARS